MQYLYIHTGKLMPVPALSPQSFCVFELVRVCSVIQSSPCLFNYIITAAVRCPQMVKVAVKTLDDKGPKVARYEGASLFGLLDPKP